MNVFPVVLSASLIAIGATATRMSKSLICCCLLAHITSMLCLGWGHAMILQNISKAIREQNYYAVVLEFFIVIAGVVIGFQINAWNEARSDREAAQLYLERLLADMERSTCTLQHNVYDSTDWNSRARRTLDAMLANDPGAVDDTGFELIASTRVNTGSLVRATLNELVNGGQVNLISDDALRAEIARADARFTQLSELIEVLVAAQDSFTPQVQNHLRPVPGEVYEITYDFEALASDDEFVNALGHALRITHVNIVWLNRMAEAADELRVSVAEALGEDTSPLDCNLPEPAP